MKQTHGGQWWAGIALMLIALAGSGCVSGMLAKMAVKAPNQQRTPRVVRDAKYRQHRDTLFAQQWRLKVGPPRAELQVGVVEPGDYAARYEIEVKTNDKGHRWPVPKLHWTVPAKTLFEVNATVLLLHGYMDSKEDVMHWAVYLAAQGYRCVLVDLRGHGRSTGDWVGFGALEVADLKQLLDDLERRGLLEGKLGVMGVSYGASCGLLLAAKDPRVSTLVALEPYSDARSAIVEFAHGVAPKQAAKISAATFQAAVQKAPRLGGFSWADADVAAAAANVKVPVLIFHGARDTWLLPKNSEVLAAKLGGEKVLRILPEDDHLSLSLRLTPIHDEVGRWFAEKLPREISSSGVDEAISGGGSAGTVDGK